MRFSDFLYEDGFIPSSSLLLCEGGKATATWNTQRANKDDVEAAIEFFSKTTGIAKDYVKDNIIGSSRLVLSNQKPSAGDVDIALPSHSFSSDEIDKKMMFATGNKGILNKGTRVASYAVPGASKDKLVQLDVMITDSTEWAKFIYHSAQGDGSKYAGVVRNVLLMSWVAHTVKPGEDVHLRDGNDETLVRASRSIHLPRGLLRMFKTRTVRADGSPGKTLKKTSPEDIRADLDRLGLKSVKFDFAEDLIDDPNKVVQWLTGNSRARAADFMTAEQVVRQMIKYVPAQERLDIFKHAKKELRGYPKDQLPEELR